MGTGTTRGTFQQWIAWLARMPFWILSSGVFDATARANLVDQRISRPNVRFVAIMLASCGLHFFSIAQAHAEQSAKKLNILFFTADDMNYDSSGVCGGPIKDLTPNIDRLAAEGLRFEYAYSTVAVCQPVRQIMQTGLYPHRSGSMGFFPIKPEVRTLNQQLHDAGYLISMFGKGRHHQPTEQILRRCRG